MGDIPAGRETKEGVRGQRPRRRSWWWALACPHRRGSCRLRRFSSSRVVGRPSVVVRDYSRSHSLSFALVVVRVHRCARPLLFTCVVVRGRYRPWLLLFVVHRGTWFVAP